MKFSNLLLIGVALVCSMYSAFSSFAAAQKGQLNLNNWIVLSCLSKSSTSDTLLDFSNRGFVEIEYGVFISERVQRYLLNREINQIDLSYNQLIRLKDKQFEGVDYLQRLDLSHNKIDEIGSFAFQDLLTLVDLDLSNNNLTFLHASTFRLLSHLGYLNLSYNNFKTLPALRLLNVFEFNLSHNQIESVHERELLYLIGIRSSFWTSIDLSNNAIERYEVSEYFKDIRDAGLFVIKVNLETLFRAIDSLEIDLLRDWGFCENTNQTRLLNLNSRKILRINSSIFKHYPRLNYLHLENNYIEDIENLGSNLARLLELYLDNNKLRFISKIDLKGMKQLQVLSLASNQIRDISDEAWKYLSNLVWLLLSSNNIEMLFNAEFNNLGKLKFLDLSDNLMLRSRQIGRWSLIDINDAKILEAKASVYYMKNLVRFNASYNLVTQSKLAEILNRLFSHFFSFEDRKLASATWEYDNHARSIFNTRALVLDSYQRLTRSEDLIFKFNGTLSQEVLLSWLHDSSRPNEHLNLIHRGISSLTEGLFSVETVDQYLKALKISTIDLSHNRLTKITAYQFEGLDYLKALRLSHNQISSIDSNAFIGLASLRSLVLSYNNLSWLNEKTFTKLYQLELLSLSHNKLKSMPKLRMMTHHLRLFLTHNLIEDISKNDVSFFRPNYRINVSFNQIKRLDYAEINVLGLADLVITGNPIEQNLTIKTYSQRNYESVIIEPINYAHQYRITRIHLTREELESWKLNGLENLTLLLNLNSRGIITLDKDIFNSFDSLSYLHLENNYISWINGQLFDSCRASLRELFLNGNMLTYIDSRVLAGLNRLQVLSLANNRLFQLQLMVWFKDTTNLAWLILNSNYFSYVYWNSEPVLKRLIYLDLSNSEIDRLNGLFVGAVYLNLSYNRIKHILFNAKHENMIRLDLTSNDLNDPGHFKPLNELCLQELGIEENLFKSKYETEYSQNTRCVVTKVRP